MDAQNHEIRVRRLIFINMEKIFSEEENLYLRRICRYLGSLGMDEGIIEFDYEEYDYAPDEKDFKRFLKSNSYFSNNYRAEIPSGLVPILIKAVNWAYANNKFVQPSQDSINYAKVEIIIDCENQELAIFQLWYYYEKQEPNVNTFDTEEEHYKEDLEEIFGLIDSTEPLELTYEGSGDSGFISNEFDNGELVPNEIQNWCYNRLEHAHGGWEINEGSQGSFTFYPKERTIELSHSYNEEISDSVTVFEAEFAKKN